MTTMNEPDISVGIIYGVERINFTLDDGYTNDGRIIYGQQSAVTDGDGVVWNGASYKELVFTPADKTSSTFSLDDVTIGIGFHWERKERQRFRGTLRIIVDNGKLTAINKIGLEDYLTSVISSEMSATSSLELLKAHAVISRSWLLSQINRHGEVKERQCSSVLDDGELIRWYDREDHKLFDVCADDHCQRYQGIGRMTTTAAARAVSDTKGEVLTSAGEICDARFSKCCGGAFEEFQYCWDNVPHSYLTKGVDTIGTSASLPDLTDEAEAERWIRQSPESFCNTSDRRILSQVLNGYDIETTNFYRWRVEHSQKELAGLIRQRSGTDYGDIIELRPLARGVSGRLWKLQIVGSKATKTIGKELEIRRTLSATHLYSSAFVVDREDIDDNGIPRRFIITGAGWGHGVGLCQIGAAVMSERGYSYQDILRHYYRGACIERKYN